MLQANLGAHAKQRVKVPLGDHASAYCHVVRDRCGRGAGRELGIAGGNAEHADEDKNDCHRCEHGVERGQAPPR